MLEAETILVNDVSKFNKITPSVCVGEGRALHLGMCLARGGGRLGFRLVRGLKWRCLHTAEGKHDSRDGWGANVALLKRLGPYLWPQGEDRFRSRATLLAAFGLLVAGKVLLRVGACWLILG